MVKCDIFENSAVMLREPPIFIPMRIHCCKAEMCSTHSAPPMTPLAPLGTTSCHGGVDTTAKHIIWRFTNTCPYIAQGHNLITLFFSLESCHEGS